MFSDSFQKKALRFVVITSTLFARRGLQKIKALFTSPGLNRIRKEDFSIGVTEATREAGSGFTETKE